MTRSPHGRKALPGWRALCALAVGAAVACLGGAALADVVPKGEAVYDLGTSQDGFAHVKYNGKSGWMSLEFLGSTTGDLEWIGQGKLTSNVNFREGPSLNNAIIKVLKKGKIVEMSDEAWDGFRLVKADGVPGWVYDQYIKKV